MQLKDFFLIPFLLICLSSVAIQSYAQTFGPIEERISTLRQNSNSTLEATENKVWIGPGLNAFDELTGEISVPESADTVFAGQGRVFSLSVKNGRVLAGIGFTSTAGGTSVNAARGYYQSFDNGESWHFLPFLLDEKPENTVCDAASVGPPCDIEFQYGDETYIRTRITVPEQSPPFEVDFHQSALLAVHWASGLLRSKDNGATWERIFLPPSNVSEFKPEKSYQWFSQTPDGEIVNRYDPRFDNNLLGFGLLIDDQQRVWVGTAAGINLSNNALSAPVDKIEWKKMSFDPDKADGLLSNWIVAIRQQPGTDRIWMTNWITDPENRDDYGVVYTDDHGETFHRFLKGVRANDIGFFKDEVYVAAEGGLYISQDDGESWEGISPIKNPNTFIKPDARYFAVTSTDENLWIGTSDGIASSSDGGESWKIYRVDVPLSGGNRYQPDAPNVETYAYPNPFSPVQHSVIRIKYRIGRPGPATIRIFDFGMNPVHTIKVPPVSTPGSYETVWDGVTESGRIVSNGTYFYSIETPDGSAEGKILLLD